MILCTTRGHENKNKNDFLLFCRPGACFSKVPKLFGRIPGDIILFVSSKRRRLEARNFAVIFTFIPFTSYKKISFTNKQVVVLRVAFRARKVLGTFEKRAPDEERGSTDCTCSVIKVARAKQEKYVDNLSLNDNYQKNSLIKDAVFSFLVFSSSEQKS